MNPLRRVLLILLPLAALVGCGWDGLDGYAPLWVFDNFHTIEPDQAYRSAQLDEPTLRGVLEDYGIRTVINLRGENQHMPWYRWESAICAELDVELVDIRMSASTLPPRDALLQLYDTFQAAEYPILIHCRSGADRTGSASAIWRMVVRGDDRAAAAAELSPCYGHFIGINPAMDELVRIFQPDRDWIEHGYAEP